MWRARAGTILDCEKTTVTVVCGMVVANHPGCSGDADVGRKGDRCDGRGAVRADRVGPMMIGIFGGGVIRLLGSSATIDQGAARA